MWTPAGKVLLNYSCVFSFEFEYINGKLTQNGDAVRKIPELTYGNSKLFIDWNKIKAILHFLLGFVEIVMWTNCEKEN